MAMTATSLQESWNDPQRGYQTTEPVVPFWQREYHLAVASELETVAIESNTEFYGKLLERIGVQHATTVTAEDALGIRSA
jgi:hypothetical protein